ncbi:MAG: hypothetical protein E7184_02910 [Erysipelotrichaceae bacterium]|nr:hypothetical protein [Erysipelotrichaceae bacterium]
MSEVIVKKVTNKKELKKFIKFPNQLYKDNPFYVPELIKDEIKYFDREKNPSYEYCESIEALAYKDNKIVGRICGLINHQYNKKINAKHLRFNHFDFIDDYEVSKALIDFISKWGKEKGMTHFNGPIGCTDLDKQGMLIEGFDKLAINFTYYNYPYYIQHLEKLKFVKDVDWVEYLINVPEKMDERLAKISNFLLERQGFKLLKFRNAKEAMPTIIEAFNVYNDAFAKLHGTVRLPERQVKQYINDYISLANFDYLSFVADKEGKVKGFAFVVPSISKALQKAKGRLFPTGWFHLLKSLKVNDTLDMYLIAVNPGDQGLGLNGIMMADILGAAIKNGIKYAETGPELEDNNEVQAQWKNFERKIIRRRRCWIREI